MIGLAALIVVPFILGCILGIIISYFKFRTISTKKAVNKLIVSLNEDPGYYYSWQANIAMSFVDEYGSYEVHEKGNAAAKRFLDLLISNYND